MLKFPSDEDLTGAAVALLRLQDTYQLDTSSVARGKLNGIQYRYSTQAGNANVELINPLLFIHLTQHGHVVGRLLRAGPAIVCESRLLPHVALDE